MKKTSRFRLLREQSLSDLFTTEKLTKTWRSIVRSQMRSLDILDLHDYYDFNSKIDSKSKEIRSQILKAKYRPSQPLVYRVEKRFGICRHLLIPSPSDALVFQTINNLLYDLVDKIKPTNKAYYSRDKQFLKLPHQFDTGAGYPWSYLWPKFQKDIWKFTEDCPYLVVTDIANFYDNIGLRELRHIVSSRITVDEVILDLLFNIIEQISWVPDYLPTSLKGLPTINLEAFRLLPHIMLFELDEVLNQDSNGNFVRWMDDINVGVESKDRGYEILGNMNDIIKSRGLALNISKTNVYTADEAKQHFFVDENTFLDTYKNIKNTDTDFKQKKRQLYSRFQNHLLKQSFKNWDKVTKRYFTEASKLGIWEFRKHCYQLYLEQPSLRKSILSYLKSRGFTDSVSRIVLQLLGGVKRYDDVTLYDFCKYLSDVEIPHTKAGKAFIMAVQKLISNPESDFDLYCYIWFLAKYGEPNILMNVIEKSKEQWKNQQFLSRQIVSIVPRIFDFNEDICTRLIDEQMTSGPSDASTVATNISSLHSTESLGRNLFSYLFPPKPQKPYPLPKYLILLAVLSSKSLKSAERKRISGKIPQYITDPWYRYWIRKYKLV